MGFFKNDKKGKPPHTWYPEILHWREGDTIYCWNVMSALGSNKKSMAQIHRYIPEGGGFAKTHFKFSGVNSNGKIFVEDNDGNILEFQFYRFIRKSENESLANRMAQNRLKGTEDYMELMENFQQAYEELAESESPKLID
ncbi:MAG: hypothetical protein ABJR05_13590 [Balneola sp.]